MPNFGHRGDVWRTAQASFVGEYATLHTHHDCAADQATKGLIEPERAFHDGHQHQGHVIKLQHNDVQGDRYVGQRFHRYQQVCHPGDAFDAAHEHQR